MRKQFTFGYDIDSVMAVQEYVLENYLDDDYSMMIGYGDDVMNYLEINVKDGDEQLMSLIYNCEGGGSFEEDEFASEE